MLHRIPVVNTPTPDADGETMARLAAGDDSALNELMQAWAPRVRAYFARLTSEETTADDLTEETFVRLYHSRGRFESSTRAGAFSTWLFGIAANVGREHFRWKKRHPTTPLESTADPVEHASPETLLEAEEIATAVRTAITQLPEELREAVLLSEYEEMTHAEIAMTTGCTPKAVERRLSRAREILRRALSGWL